MLKAPSCTYLGRTEQHKLYYVSVVKKINIKWTNSIWRRLFPFIYWLHIQRDHDHFVQHFILQNQNRLITRSMLYLKLLQWRWMTWKTNIFIKVRLLSATIKTGKITDYLTGIFYLCLFFLIPYRSDCNTTWNISWFFYYCSKWKLIIINLDRGKLQWTAFADVRRTPNNSVFLSDVCASVYIDRYSFCTNVLAFSTTVLLLYRCYNYLFSKLIIMFIIRHSACWDRFADTLFFCPCSSTVPTSTCNIRIQMPVAVC